MFLFIALFYHIQTIESQCWNLLYNDAGCLTGTFNDHCSLGTESNATQCINLCDTVTQTVIQYTIATYTPFASSFGSSACCCSTSECMKLPDPNYQTYTKCNADITPSAITITSSSNPTALPSNHPTHYPSNNPSISPIDAPSPTQSIFDLTGSTDIALFSTNIDGEDDDNFKIGSLWIEYRMYVIAVIVVLTLICITICCLCIQRKRRMHKGSVTEIIISNPMVILIGIGTYSMNLNDADIHPNDQHLRDLPVDLDIKNLWLLFRENLNYSVFPSYKQCQQPKTEWSQQTLIDFLSERASYLEQHINDFDGLFVVISCHGIRDYICTSNYKLIEKVAIHRIFSLKHPILREIPRIFIFDACDGNNSYGKIHDKFRNIDEEKDIEKIELEPLTTPRSNDNVQHIEAMEISKQFTVCDVERQTTYVWEEHTKNPDYLLAEINAANPGFESKLHLKYGSYMIYKFVKKMMKDLEHNENRFIHQIFDEIQDELQSKQQTKNTYNNGTRYIKFKQNI